MQGVTLFTGGKLKGLLVVNILIAKVTKRVSGLWRHKISAIFHFFKRRINERFCRNVVQNSLSVQVKNQEKIGEIMFVFFFFFLFITKNEIWKWIWIIINRDECFATFTVNLLPQRKLRVRNHDQEQIKSERKYSEVVNPTEFFSLNITSIAGR